MERSSSDFLHIQILGSFYQQWYWQSGEREDSSKWLIMLEK